MKALYSARWNRGAFSGEYTVGGYRASNISLTQQELTANLLSEDHGQRFMALLSAPGIVLGNDPKLVSEAEIAACASTGVCGSVNSMPASYSAGEYEYEVVVEKETLVVLNEAYYPGWQATICSTDQGCQRIAVVRSDTSLVQLQLPQGNFELKLEYVTPGRSLSWWLFGGGVSLMIVSSILVIYRRRTTVTPLHGGHQEEWSVAPEK
ncbi:hypothetical protein [Salinibacterium sp. M195]|uniref:hypothetical protein n=1 Tax=Salinibacterium sp. M195 TaxID=2583374 RepID=UPI001C62B6F7|nr:hypothetical protein [Salinibacterium sp. M195]QYH36001.1 hypothetical protein FFT87_08575 [Salinibacterium sp. M195]